MTLQHLTDTLSVKKKKKKKTGKSDQFFCGDQYLYRPKNFKRPSNTDQKFLSVIFSPEYKPYNWNIKKSYQIYHTIIWLSGVG